MADVTSSFSPDPIIRPFEGYPLAPDRAMGNNPSPVAELVFALQTQSIAAPGAGNNQVISITSSLPPNYGYAVTDISASLKSAVGAANNWPLSLVANLGGDDFTDSIELHADALVEGGAGAQVSVYRAMRLPNYVFTAASGVLASSGRNTTANDGAYTFWFYFRALMYSIAQVKNISVNTPTLTR